MTIFFEIDGQRSWRSTAVRTSSSRLRSRLSSIATTRPKSMRYGRGLRTAASMPVRLAHRQVRRLLADRAADPAGASGWRRRAHRSRHARGHAHEEARYCANETGRFASVDVNVTGPRPGPRLPEDVKHPMRWRIAWAAETSSAFYASHGPMTDPGEASALLDPLPYDVAA